MTQPMASSARPSGAAPKGSAYGLVGIGILNGLVPFLRLQSLVPVLKSGLDIWLASILPVLAAGGIASTIIVLGFIDEDPGIFVWYLPMAVL